MRCTCSKACKATVQRRRCRQGGDGRGTGREEELLHHRPRVMGVSVFVTLRPDGLAPLQHLLLLSRAPHQPSGKGSSWLEPGEMDMTQLLARVCHCNPNCRHQQRDGLREPLAAAQALPCG